MSRPFLISPTVALVAALTCAAHADTVTVSIHVRTESGAPLADAPLEAHTATQTKFVLTNASGDVTVTLESGADNDAIMAWLQPGLGYDIPSAQRTLADAKYNEYLSAYAFDDFYSIAIEDGVGSYDLTVTAYVAVTVTGRVTNQLQWYTDRVLATVKGGMWIDMLKNQEPFAAKVRLGAATELFFVVDDSTVHAVPLSAQQTQDDLDLGDIMVPITSGSFAANLTLRNFKDAYGPGRVQALWKAVTLVRADGQVILMFPVTSDGQVVKDAQTEDLESPELPTGTYYVAPGHFGYILQNRLLDKIRSGETAELDAHGVPKITVPGTLAVDVTQARNAIVAATGGFP